MSFPNDTIQIENDESLDGVIVARTQGSRMEGVDEGAMTAPQFETSFNLEWNVPTFDLSFRSFLMVQPLPVLSFIFGIFKQTSLQILQQTNVKNVHPVPGAEIRTHDL